MILRGLEFVYAYAFIVLGSIAAGVHYLYDTVKTAIYR